MSIYKICFHGEIRSMICGYSLVSGLRGYEVNSLITSKFKPEKKSRLLEQEKIELNPSLVEHTISCLSKQCRSRSIGF